MYNTYERLSRVKCLVLTLRLSPLAPTRKVVLTEGGIIYRGKNNVRRTLVPKDKGAKTVVGFFCLRSKAAKKKALVYYKLCFFLFSVPFGLLSLIPSPSFSSSRRRFIGRIQGCWPTQRKSGKRSENCRRGKKTHEAISK